jgi:hypothetical protein
MPVIPFSTSRGVSRAADIITEQAEEEEAKRYREASDAKLDELMKQKVKRFDHLGGKPMIDVPDPVTGGWKVRDSAVVEADPYRISDADAQASGLDMPMGAGGPENPADPAVMAIINRRKAAQSANLRASLMQSTSTPDQAAADIDTAQRLGVERLEVETNRKAFDVARVSEEIDKLSDRAPFTYSWLNRSFDHLEVAHDDIENLSWWEQAGQFFSPGSLTLDEMGKSIATGFADRLPQQLAGLDKMAADTNAAIYRSLPDWFPYKAELVRGQVERSNEAWSSALIANERVKANASQGETWIERGIYSAMESAPSTVAALLAGVVTRNPAVATSGMGAMTAGGAYVDAQEEGLADGSGVRSLEDRLRYALTQGGIETATEMLPMKFLLDDLAKDTPLFKTFFRQAAAEGISEQAATFLQDASTWLELNPDKTLGEFMAERPNAALETLVASTVMSGVQTAVAKGMQAAGDQIDKNAKQRRAEELAKTFDALANTGKDSKLLKRLPDKYREFVAEATKDGPLESVRIQPEAFGELAQSKQLTVEQLAKVFRVEVSAIEGAMASGEDVVIPSGNYAAGIQAAQKEIGVSGTVIHSAFAPNMRLRASDFTVREIEAMKEVADKEAKAREEAEAETGFADAADRVREDARKRLAETKRFNAETTSTQATVQAELAVTLAERIGVDPEALWAEIAPQVQSTVQVKDDAVELAQTAIEELASPRGFVTGRDRAGNQRTFSPRDLILAYNDGDTSLDMVAEFDVEGENATRDINKLSSNVRQSVRRAKAEGQLERLAEKWSVTPDELERFAAPRWGGGATEDLMSDVVDIVERANRNGMAPGLEQVVAQLGARGHETKASTLKVRLSNARTGKGDTALSDAMRERVRALKFARGRGAGQGKELAQTKTSRTGPGFGTEADYLRAVKEGDDAFRASAEKITQAGGFGDYKVSLRYPIDSELRGASFNVTKNGEVVGTFDLYSPGHTQELSLHAMVKPEFQRQGIATQFYDFVESTTGKKLRKSETMSPEGKALWDARERRGSGSKLLAQETRGGFTGMDLSQEGAIRLYESANLSTYVHETAHWYLTTLERMARGPNPHPFVISQLAAIREWQGKSAEFEIYDANGQITEEGVEVHEAFAETFEAYLREGKAPSTALRSVFATFKAWLLRVYKQITQIGQRVRLNEEIRAVFDRALATDEAIAAARRPMEQNAQQMAQALLDKKVITPKQFERTVERLAAAKEKAEAELMARLMEQYERAQKSWWRAEEREVRQDVASEIDERPEQRAYAWLSGKGWRDTLEDHVEAMAVIAELKQVREAGLIDANATDDSIRELQKRSIEAGTGPLILLFRTSTGRIIAFPGEGGQVHHDMARSVYGLGNMRLDHGIWNPKRWPTIEAMNADATNAAWYTTTGMQADTGAGVTAPAAPIVVYRGTAEDGDGPETGRLGLGVYSAEDPEIGAEWGGQSGNVEAWRISGPLFELDEASALGIENYQKRENTPAAERLFARLKAEGYVGIRDPWSGHINVFVEGAMERYPEGDMALGSTWTNDPEMGQTRQTGDRSLAVMHNLTEQNLFHAEEIGGLAAPSLAIVDTDKGVLNNFGSITLVAEPDLLSTSKIRTFDADIYSPRHPRPVYDIDDKAASEVVKELREATKGLGDLRDIDLDGLHKDGPSSLIRNEMVKAAFFASRGELPKRLPRKEIPKADEATKAAARLDVTSRETWEVRDDPRVRELAAEHYNFVIEQIRLNDAELADDLRERFFTETDEGQTIVHPNYLQRFVLDAKAYRKAAAREVDTIELGSMLSKKLRDKKTERAFEKYVEGLAARMITGKSLFKGFTNSGNRRYGDYTMETILREMMQELQSGEGWNYGAGSVRARYATELKSIAAIRARKGQLVSEEEMKAAKDEGQNALMDILDYLKPYYRFGGGNQFMQMDDMSKALAEGPKGISEAFDFRGDPEPMQRIREFIDTLTSLPTEYFEAKAQRAVDLSEFKAAVVPRGTSERALEILRKAGLQIRFYKRDDAADRQRAIRGVPGVLFQTQATRQLDALGFYSAAQEAAQRVPDNIWKMGWQAARNSLAKGHEGIVPRKTEIEYLGLDAMFGDTKLKGAALKDAVLEHIAAKRLSLVENFARFDPNNLKTPTKRVMLREMEGYALADAIGLYLRPMGEGRVSIETDIGEDKSNLYLQRTTEALSRPSYYDLIRYYDGGKREVLANGVEGDLRGKIARLIVDENFAKAERNISAEALKNEWLANGENKLVRGPGDIRLPGEDVPLFEMVIALPPGVHGSDYRAPVSHVGGKAKGTLVTAHGEERIDDKGQRTVFVGQVQSDMAQEAREEKVSAQEAIKTMRVYEYNGAYWVSIGGGVSPNGPYNSMEEAEARLAQLKEVYAVELNAPLLSTSEWTNVAVRAMIYRAAREGFQSISFPTAETSEIIQGNDSAAMHYETNVKGALEKLAKQLGGEVRRGSVDYDTDQGGEYQHYDVYGSNGRKVFRYYTLGAAELAIKRGEGVEIREGSSIEPPFGPSAPAYILDITPAMRAKIVAEGFPLFQTRRNREGRAAPPPNLPPMRLDLAAVEDQYGPEALAALPPEVRAYSAQATDAGQYLDLARDIRRTLNKKHPKSLWKFFATQRRIGEGDGRIAYSGIRDDGGEIKKMIGDRKEAPGLISDRADTKRSRSYDLDSAIIAATEEGYFSSDNIPTIAQFLEILRADIDGTAPLYRRDEVAIVDQIRTAQQWAAWFDQNDIDIYEKDGSVLLARIAERLSRNVQNAISPDEAAPFFKMPDGRALLEALKQGPLRERMIAEETRRRMIERHGDILNDGTLMAEAMAFARNEMQTRQDEIELEALAMATGSQKAPSNLAREMARERLRDKQVREVLNYNQWLMLEQRWMKKAVEAAEKGKLEDAMEFKRFALINRAMFFEGRKLAERIEKDRAHILDYGSRTKQARLFAAGPEYQQHMNDLLADYQFRNETKKREGERVARNIWIRQQLAALDPYAAYRDSTLTEAEQQAKAAEDLEKSAALRALDKGGVGQNYKSLTVAELQAVRDEADIIWKMATTADQLLKQGERRRLTLAAKDVAAEIETSQPNEKPPEPIETDTPGERVKRSALKYFAMHRTLQSWARQFAGGKDGGKFWDYIVRPLNEAFARLSSLRKQMGEDVAGLFAVYSEAEQKRMFRDRQTFDWTATGGRRLTLSKQGRLAFALNWGNDKNRNRLMDSLGLEPQHVQQVLETLTKKDWDFVQKTWDYLDTWFPEANRVHEAIHGAPMDKEAPLEIATRFGIYRGGYYPIKFDPMLSSKAGQRQVMEDVKPATGQLGAYQPGFAKARSKGRITLPLRLSVVDVISSHLDQVARSIATDEALFDAGRIVKQPEVEKAIVSRHGREVYNTIINTLITAKFGLEGASGLLAHLRNGATVVGLGWKVSTALLQPLGISNSIVRVGGYWVAKGYARMGKDAATVQSSANWIMQRSEFMRNRRQANSPEMAALRKQVKAGVVDLRIPGLGLSAKAFDAIKDNAFALMANVQFYSVDMPTWFGAYYKARAAGMNEGDAVASADQAVIDSQGGGELHQTSAMQTGAGTRYAAALRLLTNFMSYMITTYNLAVQRTRNARTPAQIAALALDYVILLSVPVAGKMMIDAWTKGDGEDEDEENPLWERYGREQLAFIFSPFVGVSQIAGTTRGEEAFGYRGPAGLGIFAEATNAGRAAFEADFDESFWRPANRAAGMIFHYPAGQIDASIRGAAAYFNGETDNPAAFLVGPPPAN